MYDFKPIFLIFSHLHCDYYYDNEIELYYLQSRYYDVNVSRFVNSDDSCLLQTIDNSINDNLLTYCFNVPTNVTDASGYISLKSIISKLEDCLKRVANEFKEYIINDLIIFNRWELTVYVSTTLMSTAIDTIISLIVRAVIYNGIKATMKTMLRFASIRNDFIASIFDFFLTNTCGKFILWILVKIAFNKAGKAGLVSSIASGIFEGFIEKIASSKSIILGNAISYISAFSSIGGIIALLLDIIDGKPDGWIKIKIINNCSKGRVL